MRAVLSDVLANLPALRAVLADIEEAGATGVLCLGDVVGVGPSPAACLDLVQGRCDVVLKGHVERCLLGETQAGPGLEKVVALDWTRRQVVPGALSPPAKRRRWAAVASAPRVHRSQGLTFCHTSPADWDCGVPLFPLNMGSTTQAEHRETFATFERALVTGASRRTYVFDERIATSPRDEVFAQQMWQEGLGSHELPPEGKTVVHVGSVGRPADGDPRACYALIEGDVVTWRRVEYDVEEAIALAKGAPLHPAYAGWLREGL